jgi:hypothetical protein
VAQVLRAGGAAVAALIGGEDGDAVLGDALAKRS